MAAQKRKAAAVAGKQMDLFVALAVDVPLRDQADTMERPFFSLSKTPRTEPIIYETESCSVEVRGSDGTGIATIWDADILIVLFSGPNPRLQAGKASALALDTALS